MKNKVLLAILAAAFILTLTLASCGGGGGAGSTPVDNSGGNTGGNNSTPDGTPDIPANMSAYVSTHLTDVYVYELSFESTSSSARAAVSAPTPKEGGFYSLLVYDKNDGKVKGVSEGTIKGKSGGLTLKPNDTDDPDIEVTVSGGEMTEVKDKVKKGGNHDLPGKVNPFKQTEGVSGDFKYVTNPGNTVTITKYTRNEDSVVIPEKIDGKTVIGIGYLAFYDINSYSRLTSVTIPNSVTSIGAYAFIDCLVLTSVTIPNNVTSIGFGAFMHCVELNSVTLGNSVTIIGEVSFEDCTSLTSITIPNSVTSIGKYAFYDCTSLTAINVDAGNTEYSSQDGILYNKAKTVIVCVPSKITGTITIPNSVNFIGDSDFRGRTSLTNVIIGNSVTIIEDGAFNQCINLISVTISNSVTNIGRASFAGCTSLANVIIGNSVISIEYNAFGNCPSLTSVTIPNSVTSIGDYAFSSKNLTSVTFASGSNIQNANFGSYAFPEGSNGYGNSLKTAYSTGKAGTYTREVNGATWTKQS